MIMFIFIIIYIIVKLVLYFVFLSLIKKNFPVIPKCTNITISLSKKNNRYLDFLKFFNLNPIILIFFYQFYTLIFHLLFLLLLNQVCVLLIKDLLTTSTSGNSGI